MDWGKIDYSDDNRMYINQGSNDGITEADIFMVIGQGGRIRSPVTRKRLGTYHLKKSLAKIYCLYENTAVITLMKGCQPVQIGDILIPYKPEDILFEEKLVYTNCRLPMNGIEGNVVYQDIYTNYTRELASFSQYVSIDLGKAMVSKGEWVLFYRRIKPNLPPIIIGTGVVINTQNTSSTVVVLDSGFEVELLNKVVLLGKHQPQKKMTTRTGASTGGEENIPIIKTLKDETGPGEQGLDLTVNFDINQTSVGDEYKPDLEKIPGFINDKSQYVIILRGYACSIGGLEHNLKLSQDRVNSVKKYLVDTFNIGEEFFETYHYGEKDPPFDNSSEEQRKKNRRVNIEVRAK
ncbi:MAG: OmpA family protein [bacterium]|nr:OmpA family protein [bacterium]